jgi:hypothetical protein
MKILTMLIALALFTSRTTAVNVLPETRITRDDSKNHDMDNNDNFSPDGQWLVYDTRTAGGGIGGCATIERVNLATGETATVFEIRDNQPWGPGVGAVSYHPTQNQVVFIHGLASCSEQNPYQQWRRTGMIVDADQPQTAIAMDARDVTYPYTPGALRGGSHRHEWRGDGAWIGYTYNDAIMQHLQDSTGIKWNLRTIAVSKYHHAVAVDQDPNGENVNGSWFSVVVVRVVPDPKPGSDDISHAASDSWVGAHGYKKSDGSWQVARAFLGKVRNRAGRPVDELFVVDIPDSIDLPGDAGPLQGTPTSFPMPPRGTVQRRLTFTADSPFPGCGGVVRSAHDGGKIAYLAKDSQGIQQVFLISPLGGEPTQCTWHTSDVQSGVRWSPDDQSLVYLWDNSITLCQPGDKPFASRYRRLTQRSAEPPSNLVWSHDGTLIAFNRSVAGQGQKEATKQIFVIRLR